MKRCSTLLGIREMKVKTVVKYHFVPVSYNQREIITGVGQNVETLETLDTVKGKVNGIATLETVWQFLEGLNIELLFEPAILLPAV